MKYVLVVVCVDPAVLTTSPVVVVFQPTSILVVQGGMEIVVFWERVMSGIISVHGGKHPTVLAVVGSIQIVGSM